MNDDTKQPIDRLMDKARIKGESRMIPDNADPASISKAAAQAVIDRILGYIKDAGISRGAIAKGIDIGGPTLGSVLNWKYTGAWQAIIQKLDLWLEEQLLRDAAPKLDAFVPTRVAKEIKLIADVASTLQTIGLVYGPTTSGIGKTMALRAIAQDKPGSVLVTVEQMGASRAGLVKSIATAMRIGETNTQRAYARIKEQLSGRGGSGTRLLMIDQIHNLCGCRGDAPLFMLADLFDATGAPQLWCGTSDIVAYLERSMAKGQQTLAQIHRRIGVQRDLLERTREESGGDGDPLFTVDEIRRVFARGKMRLANDAIKYLSMLANLPDSGALGMCMNLVKMATMVHDKSGVTLLTADHLRAVHRMLVSRRVYSKLEAEMDEYSPAQPAMKVG